MLGVSKNIVWFIFMLDKEVFGTKTLFGAVYLPCERGKSPDRSAFADLRNDIKQFQEMCEVPICLIGDFNARTGRMQDFISVDHTSADITGLDGILNDLQPLPPNLVNIDLLRENMDWGVNKNGRQLIDFCKHHNLRIMNGRAGSDRGIGNITCHNRNGGKSAVDLVVASPGLLESVSDFQVLPMDKDLSDAHCAISVSFRCEAVVADKDTLGDVQNEHADPKFQWDSETKAAFVSYLEESDLGQLENKLTDLEESPTDAKMDEISSDLRDILITAAKKAGSLKDRFKPREARKTNDSKPWFDKDLRMARASYMKAKNFDGYTSTDHRHSTITEKQ